MFETVTIEDQPMELSTQISSSSKRVAKDLLNLRAVQFNVKEPFTWVSGIKSPVYCDNRVVISDVEIRKRLIGFFLELIQQHFQDVQIIAGVATGGIPMGVLIADRMNLPFVYVRQVAKEHGLKRQVEGSYTFGNNVVVIEDHISTGSSSSKAIQGLRNEGLSVLGLVSIMTYGFKAAVDLFNQEKVIHYSLCNLDTMLDVALDNKRISNQEKESILSFRNSPEHWAGSIKE
ncbi:MAG: orotate phosphoribosyltransferase [Chitinophagales bacterium]|nr:orotate phosphoribosyltransferase [Chitinophagales bacterium]